VPVVFHATDVIVRRLAGFLDTLRKPLIQSFNPYIVAQGEAFPILNDKCRSIVLLIGRSGSDVAQIRPDDKS
jgi:hypothetical protein